MDIILTHENADFDAVAGLFAASRLFPDSVPLLPDRLNQNVIRFLALYGGGFPFVRQVDLGTRTISRITLVDTQRLPAINPLPSDISVTIYDHHALVGEMPAAYQFNCESVGAITTALVEHIRQQGIGISSLEATLLMLGIYEDTGSLTYGTTTVRDIQAAAWLLEQQAVLDTVRRFLSQPLNAEQQNLLELLMDHMQTRTIQGYTVSVCPVSVPEYIAEVSSVVHRLRDLIDSAALFVVVDMPMSQLLVARSIVDGVDVGKIARLLGGGGHERASAATIRDRSLDEIVAVIWQTLETTITPVAVVADLMSYGVQTVEAGQPLRAVIRRLRQIGHEGFPVMDAGLVVGLLTRRDADRADEHQMRDLRAQDVMLAGNITVTRETSIFELEQVFFESGWGQIPVVDASGQLIGIVTRTDLLKYWSKMHPSSLVADRTITQKQLDTMLGRGAASCIRIVAERAQADHVEAYLVGGVVRDLLLGRANYDIDFVIEGDAIAFAEHIRLEQGGDVTPFKPFGTARWNPANKDKDGAISDLPEQIDFASARYEFYEQPTALPTVYNGSIKLDLQRRDFTINTLAVQLSPASAFGYVVDFYGGIRDMDAKLIRVLHSLSFIDDPTRILRAVRFEGRLGFKIEPRTSELMTTALPMLGRITGERLRNELTLLLHEREPERGLLNLQARGVLRAIHPAFVIDERVSNVFHQAREERVAGFNPPDDIADLYWHVLGVFIEPDALESLCGRLLFGRRLTESMLQAARLFRQSDELAQTDLRPSSIVSRLETAPELALLALWYVVENDKVRGRIEEYWAKWRHVKAFASGDTLRESGLKPGRCYSVILQRLRDAWLDGELTHKNDEQQYIRRLIYDENVCDGNT